MKTVAYARLNSENQTLNAQLLALKEHGYDHLYVDQQTDSKVVLKQLELAIDSLKPGDTFIIFKLDRLALGTTQLLELMEEFSEKNINFISLHNKINTSNEMGKIYFEIMSAFAELESDLIKERVKAGLDEARSKGVILGRPPENHNLDNVIYEFTETTKPITEIAHDNGISRPTVYRYLRSQGIDYRHRPALKRG